MDNLIAGNVKAAFREVSTGRRDIYLVPPANIYRVPGFNDARTVDPLYPHHVEEIGESILANGFFIHKPLKVFVDSDGKLHLRDGYTRMAGIDYAMERGAVIEAVPVVATTRGTSDADQLFEQILDNKGSPFTPMGEAVICRNLIARGVTEKEIARRLFRENVQKVQNLLNMLAYPTEIKEMIQSGRVSSTLAQEVVRSQKDKAIEVLRDGAARAEADGKEKMTKKHIRIKPPIEKKLAKLPAASSVHAALSPEHRAAITIRAIELMLEAVARVQ